MRRRFKAEQRLNFIYDHQADVLSISTGQSVYTDSDPLDENVILHVDPQTQAIVGFAIVDFIKRFVNKETPASVPIVATFERAQKAKAKKKVGKVHHEV